MNDTKNQELLRCQCHDFFCGDFSVICHLCGIIAITIMLFIFSYCVTLFQLGSATVCMNA